MKRYLYILLAVLLQLNTIVAQQADKSVGLVLSGGGAKGAVHIGIIKALEENDIPIDYISGTSIGAIVGAMYAMGYTPDEMLELFMSKDFYYWQTGKVEEAYQYYFRQPPANASFVNFNVPIHNPKKTSFTDALLPNSLINPIQMNQAFLQVFTPATTQCGGDFDKLFVPFLCVASDVYNKEPVIFRSGNLGDAVRASMTFPLFFKPLIKDSIPLWDGGIYDNFPVKPMKQAWRPNFIIGSAVAGGKTDAPKDQTIYEQMESLVMQKTNYRVDPQDGIIMKFKLDDVSLLDFQKSKELFDLGYTTTLSMIDSIKGRIDRRVPLAEVNERRKQYTASLPPLIFKNVYIHGKEITDAQKSYIERQIHPHTQQTFTMEEFKRIYFRLLTNSKIKEIMPHAKYNQDMGCYDLYLDVTMNDELTVEFGGDISSNAANQVYLGFNYRSLTMISTNVNLDVQLGNAYNGATLQGKWEITYHIPFDLSALLSYHTRDYFDTNKLFIDTDLAAFSSQTERFAKVGVGMPFLTHGKVDFLAGIGGLEDQYYQNNSQYQTGFDKSQYSLINLGMYYKQNSTDAKQFPISGEKHYLFAQFVSGEEHYTPSPSVVNKLSKTTVDQSYIQLDAGITNFHRIARRFTLGVAVQGVVSNKRLWSNYTASVLQAPGFTPTPHSVLVFNEAFHANEYVAAGLLPIWKINSTFHLRNELYAFVPIRPLVRLADNTAEYGDPLSKYAYMGEVSLVAQLPFMSISAFVNHYSFPKANWNFGVNIGYLIFDKKFIQ
ncbi:MAG: patatin-like phospholipase family protein [Candidatus Symbiothrix sp.]|jgi:NTE family protein|nr:patatin-like phospholipase family protein [Candidatus Symbiothrix sp.]